MALPEIVVENLGPITNKKVFKLEGYGVTILSGPNGTGKSTILDATSKAASGTGKLSLRRGASFGSVSVCGVLISLSPSATRYNGEFQVSHLEGKFDLGKLVDPGVKDPIAADKRRIKSLISLLGVVADFQNFCEHPAFDSDELFMLCDDEIRDCNDLVDMAAQITRAYHRESRTWESQATHDDAVVKVCEEALEGLDMNAETDAVVLQEAYEKAHATHCGIKSASVLYDGDSQVAAEARIKLAEIDESDVKPLAEAKAAHKAAVDDCDECKNRVRDLESQLAQAKTDLIVHKATVETLAKTWLLAKNIDERRAECRKAIDRFESKKPIKEEDIEAATATFNAAKLALETGIRIRDAVMKSRQAETFRNSAESRRKKAEELRNCAASTDLVLSAAIPAGILQIKTIGVNQRLFINHPNTGEEVPFHDLSEGERWRVAIKLGSVQVGRGGLLAVTQEAFEGLDVWTRNEIDKFAKELEIYILTGEATRDTGDGEEIVAKHLKSIK